MPGVSSGAHAPVAFTVIPAASSVPSRKLDALPAQSRRRLADPQHRAILPRALQQIARRARRIDHGIVRHQQRARQARPQIRLGLRQRRASSTSARTPMPSYTPCLRRTSAISSSSAATHRVPAAADTPRPPEARAARAIHKLRE